MRRIVHLLIILNFISFNVYSFGNNKYTIDSNLNDGTTKINKWRLATAIVTTSSTLGVAYYKVQNEWWSENSKSFHIDTKNDYRYAKNIDKIGHFLGGDISAELLQAQLSWAGLKKNQAYFYGFLMSTSVQLFIELKDAYAPTYGFSIGDVAAGSAGAFYHYMKSKSKFIESTDLKWSYYKRHDYYFREYKFGAFHDDYMNQTYWLSMSINDWMKQDSKFERIWPDFLTVCVGMGVDEKLNSYYNGQQSYEVFGTGSYEYYLSLDLDWRKILPQNKAGWRTVTKVLNHVKAPLPTLRFGPSTKAHLWYL